MPVLTLVASGIGLALVGAVKGELAQEPKTGLESVIETMLISFSIV